MVKIIRMKYIDCWVHILVFAELVRVSQIDIEDELTKQFEYLDLLCKYMFVNQEIFILILFHFYFFTLFLNPSTDRPC